MKNASFRKQLGTCQGIGIDVSKAELVVGGLTPGDPMIKRVSNQRSSVKTFVRAIRDSDYRGKIICESTGHYHLKLMLACVEAGVELTVLNPLQASKHSQAKIRKTKTDAVDALILASMCLTEPNLPKPTRSNAADTLIRLKMGQLAGLEKQLQQGQRSMNQYVETYAELGFELSPQQQALQAYLRELKKLRRQMERELEDLLVEHSASDDVCHRLSALPGYSRLVCGLVGQFDRKVTDARGWVAYVGMDVSVRESGTWKGRGRLTKRGNAYLRKRLYQAAWGAYMHDAAVKAYYDDLKAQGRKHVEALCIIARKQLRIAFEIVVHGKTYDPSIAFAH
jgi:transposase